MSLKISHAAARLVDRFVPAPAARLEVLEAYVFGSTVHGESGPTSDVVALNGAPPLLYHCVLRDGVRVLARDLAATTRREGDALLRYCDYLPQLAKIEAAHRRRIVAGAFGQRARAASTQASSAGTCWRSTPPSRPSSAAAA